MASILAGQITDLLSASFLTQVPMAFVAHLKFSTFPVVASLSRG